MKNNKIQFIAIHCGTDQNFRGIGIFKGVVNEFLYHPVHADIIIRVFCLVIIIQGGGGVDDGALCYFPDKMPDSLVQTKFFQDIRMQVMRYTSYFSNYIIQ